MRPSTRPTTAWCLPGVLGSGQFGIPDVHLGGDAIVVLLSAGLLLLASVWLHRRVTTTARGTEDVDTAFARLTAGLELEAPTDQPTGA